MTFHIPRPVRLGRAVLSSSGGRRCRNADRRQRERTRESDQLAQRQSGATLPRVPWPPGRRRSRMVLRVRRPPRAVATDDVLVTGSVTRGATVTGRGQDARVHRGRFHIRLELRVGVNRFTVVARRDGHRTTRRRVRVLRRPPAPPPPTARPSSVTARPSGHSDTRHLPPAFHACPWRMRPRGQSGLRQHPSGPPQLRLDPRRAGYSR